MISRLFVTLSLLLVVATPATSSVAHAQVLLEDKPAREDSDRIVEIRVEGNRRVEAPAVARALRQKVGDLFEPSRTADDLRALWALKYFNDLQLLVQRTPKGIAYVVRVTEKPAIRSVQLSGNDELSKDDFKDVIDIKAFTILDVAAVKRNEKKILEKYVEKGFFLAEVEAQLKPVGDEGTEVDLVFAIKEHAKVMVKEIVFLGVEKVNPDELKGVMATQEGGYLSFLTSQGTYREELFQRDLQVIQMAYFDRGFINVRVDKPVVTLSPDKRYISITIRVEEGDSYTVGKLDFSGDLLVTKDALHRLMTSKEKTTFNRSLLAKDIQAITDVYYDSGYAYANITPVTAVNAEAKTIDLTFDVQKGPKVYIERIDITGNTKTRDKVIRRQLRVYEGELFSGTGMRRSKEKVTALGFFETVEVTHKPGSDGEHVVVQVEIKEKSTGTFQVGLGFSNVESFIFTAQVAQQNFLGWGQSVSASAQLSGLRSFFQLSYFDPYFLDTNFIFSIDAYRTQLDYFGFVRDAFGGTASLGYYVIPDEMSLNLGYTYENVNVTASSTSSTAATAQLADQYRSGSTSAVRLSWTWDKRNNRLFPSQGWLSFASVETAPSFLNTAEPARQYNFNRFTAYQRVYFPLPLGSVFKMNLQVGYLQEHFPRAELGPNGEPTGRGPLPISEQYFLGGINTIRGYPLRQVAPSQLIGTSVSPDATVTPLRVGGNKQLIFNAELEIPLLEKVGIRGVLFFDCGNTFDRNSNFFDVSNDATLAPMNLPLGLLYSVGFGVRWFSPIGPLRFEWGIPLTRRPGDQPIQFEFTIGNSF
ncbi:MAG: outer membrane protein assembly factor BamA [Myxococcota bacterium]